MHVSPEVNSIKFNGIHSQISGIVVTIVTKTEKQQQAQEMASGKICFCQ